MMGNNELWVNINLQNHSMVNGRNVWHFLISSSIGNFAIVDYEQSNKKVKRFIFNEDYEASEKKYESLIIGIIKGKV